MTADQLITLQKNLEYFVEDWVRLDWTKIGIDWTEPRLDLTEPNQDWIWLNWTKIGFDWTEFELTKLYQTLMLTLKLLNTFQLSKFLILIFLFVVIYWVPIDFDVWNYLLCFKRILLFLFERVDYGSTSVKLFFR